MHAHTPCNPPFLLPPLQPKLELGTTHTWVNQQLAILVDPVRQRLIYVMAPGTSSSPQATQATSALLPTASDEVDDGTGELSGRQMRAVVEAWMCLPGRVQGIDAQLPNNRRTGIKG